ncbi:MAG TPA: sigma-70 family RNA polymerase sigma factor [Candidatus Limnocylindrales bacterium]|nr:sigma-70 family RNA polymerase sigma factor [Candidatus Limnocylindrales bacterium]
MNAAVEISAGRFDFDTFFQANYGRIAHAIARIVGDHARAEDLAAEAFWKLWRTPKAQGENAGGWVYTAAIRLGLNELRGSARRRKYEAEAGPAIAARTPEQERAAAEQREHVRRILAKLDARDAELLLLRGADFSYAEIAGALDINPASVGTLLSRAQQAFRKEYVRNYGEPG